MFNNVKLVAKFFKPLLICTRNHQVTVMGGATDIGQTICLLLRSQPNISKLVIHDTQVQTQGVALDLSHVPTNAAVKSYVGNDTIEEALKNSEVIICTGGTIHKPGISEKLWFDTNSNFIKTLSREIARLKPVPFIGIVTEPINSIVPMAAEVIRNHGEYNPKKLFGITNIDVLRAQSLYAIDYNLHPHSISLPVIGGHSEKTCIPLLSQAVPSSNLSENAVQRFTLKLRQSDNEITRAKRGFAPVLPVAYSAFLFTRSVLDVLDGKQGCVNAYIENNDFGTEYFSGIVNINENGIIDMRRYTKLSRYECHLLEDSIPQLRKDILKGKKTLEYA